MKLFFILNRRNKKIARNYSKSFNFFTYSVRILQNTERVKVSFLIVAIPSLFLPLMLIFSSPAIAMQPLSAEDMSQVNAQGIAIGTKDFDFRMAPTSYIEFTGSEPSSAARSKGWDRGDVRFYGLTISSADGNSNGLLQWDGSCQNDRNLCPISAFATGDNFAPVNNPYVFRAFENPGQAPDSTPIAPTNLELISPSKQGDWRWAFWGEVLVDRDEHVDGGGRRYLQSQTVIRGKNTTTDRAGHPLPVRPTALRAFRTQDSRKTLGLAYEIALSGDFRFSVRQTNGSAGFSSAVPQFEGGEGLYFKNVTSFIPLGQLHYQPLTFRGIGDGNFELELAQIPEVSYVYREFYCGAARGSFCAKDSRGRIANPNPDTHGYVHFGSWYFSNGDQINPYGNSQGTSGNVPPTATSEGNGIFFAFNNSSPVTNVGTARAEGLLIHGMKITTLGL